MNARIDLRANSRDFMTMRQEGEARDILTGMLIDWGGLSEFQASQHVSQFIAHFERVITAHGGAEVASAHR